jgi:hypothetical protein
MSLGLLYFFTNITINIAGVKGLRRKNIKNLPEIKNARSSW